MTGRGRSPYRHTDSYATRRRPLRSYREPSPESEASESEPAANTAETVRQPANATHPSYCVFWSCIICQVNNRYTRRPHFFCASVKATQLPYFRATEADFT
jgi:hypothetical protein